MSTETVFCEECGTANRSEWSFCSNCGSPLTAVRDSLPPTPAQTDRASTAVHEPVAPRQRPPRQRAMAPALIALVVLILLGATGAGLYVGGVFGSKRASRLAAVTRGPRNQPTPTVTGTPTQTIVTEAATQPTQTTPPVPQPTAADRTTIVDALNSYVQAWRNVSPRELGTLLTSNVLRIGSANGTCGTTVGRANVVDLYAASEMTASTSNYALVNMNPSVVQFTSATAAKVLDSYSIDGSQSRFVNFTFVKQGKSWLISKIHAWCKS